MMIPHKFFLYVTVIVLQCTVRVIPTKVGSLSTLGELLIDYESDVRPSQKNGSTDVYLSLHIIQAQWQSEHLTLVFYMRQWWHDPRLCFKGYDEIQVPTRFALKLWNPALFSPSDVDFRVLESGIVRIQPDGLVMCSQRCMSTFPCALSADNIYKHDGKLNCTLAVESYNYDDSVVLHWKEPITIAKDQANKLSVVSAKDMVTYTAVGNFSRLEATMQVQTDITKQLLNYYVRKLAKL